MDWRTCEEPCVVFHVDWLLKHDPELGRALLLILERRWVRRPERCEQCACETPDGEVPPVRTTA